MSANPDNDAIMRLKLEVERAVEAIELHFLTRFGATLEVDGPSRLIRCLGQTAFNSHNLAVAIVAALSTQGEGRTIVREKCPYVLPTAMRGEQCPNCDCAEGKSGTLGDNGESEK